MVVIKVLKLILDLHEKKNMHRGSQTGNMSTKIDRIRRLIARLGTRCETAEFPSNGESNGDEKLRRTEEREVRLGPKRGQKRVTTPNQSLALEQREKGL